MNIERQSMTYRRKTTKLGKCNDGTYLGVQRRACGAEEDGSVMKIDGCRYLGKKLDSLHRCSQERLGDDGGVYALLKHFFRRT